MDRLPKMKTGVGLSRSALCSAVVLLAWLPRAGCVGCEIIITPRGGGDRDLRKSTWGAAVCMHAASMTAALAPFDITPAAEIIPHQRGPRARAYREYAAHGEMRRLSDGGPPRLFSFCELAMLPDVPSFRSPLRIDLDPFFRACNRICDTVPCVPRCV